MTTRNTVFATNDILTANDLNALAGLWNSYTPTLGVFTPGNGTAAGSYIQFGKLVAFKASFTFGSTSAAATGSPSLTLPVNSAGSSFVAGHFTGAFYDTSAATVYMAFPRTQGFSGKVGLSVIGASGAMASCTTTTPFAWAVGDKLELFGLYEAA